MVAGLPAGDPVKVTVGGFADRHALGGKGSADVAEIAFVLWGCSVFIGSQSSHIRVPPNNLNAEMCVRSQVTHFNAEEYLFLQSNARLEPYYDPMLL